jgi:hypothetical protein
MLRERLHLRDPLLPAFCLTEFFERETRTSSLLDAPATFGGIPSLAVATGQSHAGSVVAARSPLLAATASAASAVSPGFMSSGIGAFGALLQGWPAKAAAALFVLSAASIAPGAREFVSGSAIGAMFRAMKPTMENLVVKLDTAQSPHRPDAKKSDPDRLPIYWSRDAGTYSSSPEPGPLAIFAACIGWTTLRRRPRKT